MAVTKETSTGSWVASAMALFSRSLDVCTRSLTLPMYHVNQFSRMANKSVRAFLCNRSI
jgi:hypothetical protein